MDYDELEKLFSNAGNKTRCTDLINWLESAGFKLKKGKRGNHYTFTHDGIDGFTTSDFDCGHGKNSEVKKPFITKILNHVIKQYKTELEDYFKKQKG